MLLLSPTTTGIDWCHAAGEKRYVGRLSLPGDPTPDFEQALATVSTIVYRLPSGGPFWLQPVAPVGPQDLQQLQACADFLPSFNGPIVGLIGICLEARPDAIHVLLCDTAMFAHLPQPAAAYGLPFERWQEGFRRYGGDGVCHTWSARRIRQRLPVLPARWLSVHLGRTSSVAAFKGQEPVECSMGFTPVEGISGLHTCGDIDPAIPLLLHAAGLSISEIESILTRDGGLVALANGPVTYSDVLAGQDPGTQLARSVLCHQVVGRIGAGLAALDGLDALLFAVEEMPFSLPLLRAICHHLEFAGVSCLMDQLPDREWVQSSEPEAPVSVWIGAYDQWEAMRQAAEPAIGGTARQGMSQFPGR